MILGRGISSQMRAPFFHSFKLLGSSSSSQLVSASASASISISALHIQFTRENVLSLQCFTPANKLLPRGLSASPNGLQAENEETKPVLSSPPPHRSPEQKEFSPCRPLLAQTSTTPHTEAHRHRGRRSCAWSLETYRSRREPRSKGLFFMIFPFPLFGFRIIDGFFLFSGFMGFFGAA